jgi:hypothetical protein
MRQGNHAGGNRDWETGFEETRPCYDKINVRALLQPVSVPTIVFQSDGDRAVRRKRRMFLELTTLLQWQQPQGRG